MIILYSVLNIHMYIMQHTAMDIIKTTIAMRIARRHLRIEHREKILTRNCSIPVLILIKPE